MLTPDDIRAVQGCIHDLEYLLKNWEYFENCEAAQRVMLDAGDFTREMFAVDYGLCTNIFDPNKLPNHIKYIMFKSWDGFSGNTVYPVDGEYEYEACWSGNLYQNPKRKDLAEFCVKYLKFILE